MAPLPPPGIPEARPGQGEMVKLPGSLAWSPALSVTLMVNVNLPAARVSARAPAGSLR